MFLSPKYLAPRETNIESSFRNFWSKLNFDLLLSKLRENLGNNYKTRSDFVEYWTEITKYSYYLELSAAFGFATVHIKVTKERNNNSTDLY